MMALWSFELIPRKEHACNDNHFNRSFHLESGGKAIKRRYERKTESENLNRFLARSHYFLHCNHFNQSYHLRSDGEDLKIKLLYGIDNLQRFVATQKRNQQRRMVIQG
uniref:Uncharacterized protein n=1 Tax=Nelumbo nucifera TaxID=4432 RepID=A0A822ZP11_NELNU|nr:TPA_asm: hypothetical protein HUJ06_016909 [Nelumbo nucifera]